MATSSGMSEYDRFGPWIDEVRVPDDVPRLFRDYPLDLAGARLVLKVPRNIARRDATADMDLYDHLLIVGGSGLTVLSRRTQGDGAAPAGPGASSGAGYDVREVPFAAVAAVRDVVNLLDGALSVHTRDGSRLTIRYNGSARQNVRRLVDELRSAVASTPPSLTGEALLDAAGRLHAEHPPLELGRDDPALAADYHDVACGVPTLTPWAGHGRRRVARRGGGSAKALDTVAPVVLHGAVLAGDSRALEVFGRHEWLLRGKKPVQSSSRLMIPLGGIDGVEVTPHPRYAGVSVVAVTVGAFRTELVLPDGSDAHRLFTALTVAR